MDKLKNKGKSKSLPQFKVPNTPWGQFLNFRGYLEVILRSFRGQMQYFYSKCSSMDKLLKGKNKSPTLFKVSTILGL